MVGCTHVPETFDEDLYLLMHADVAQAVRDKNLESGLQHYLHFGMTERRALRSRTDRDHGRIVIAGTGRTGTTLLVQIFTALGFETGFSLDDALTQVDVTSRAGLEQVLAENSPLLVKWPWLAEHFKGRAIPPTLNVLFLLLPMRTLSQAAESRRRVSRMASAQSDASQHYPGGLWLTEDPSRQEDVLARQFYETVILATRSGIRPIFMEFPHYARDVDGLWKDAALVWQTYGISKHELANAQEKIFDASRINV